MPTPNGPHRIAVAGNPNTGKTTLFNRLTGSRAKVGNYPGVTVDRRVGKMKLPGAGEVEVIDVPGTYSLAARSAEEQVAISVVAGLPPYERPDLVVAVVDATNLIRNLYLVLQLIELGSPVVVALNMVDLLEESGQHVHPKKLQEALGVPVVDIVALRGEGLAPLLVCIDQVLEDPSKGLAPWPWSPEEDPLLDADVRSVEAAIPEEWADPGTDRAKALALWALLSVDDHDELLAIPPELRDVVERKRHLAEISGRRIEEEIIRGRYDWLDAAAPLFLHDSGAPVTFTDRADRLLLHPALGFVVFLGLMGLVFQSLFAWADPAISAIERAFAWLADSAAAALPPGLPTDLLVGGVIPGVGSVLVFLPQILLLFFFIGVMEDTGYMARVAYLMDRIMKLLGLHGRAFVPMLSGYACAVPAILATRTMERRRDRLLTMMVVPLMTCSARLPVYGLLIATLVPPGGGNAPVQGLLLTGMYLFSTIVTLAAAAVLGRTILPGKRTPLLLEMPPYRMPHWPSLLRMLWERCWVFLREAGTVILLCTIAIWALLSFPRTSPEGEHFEVLREAAAASGNTEEVARLDHELAGANLRASYGGRIGRAIEPVIAPLGFDWEIGIGLMGAFAAREVFVSTMAVVYDLDAGSDSSSRALRDRIRAQKRPDGSPLYTPLVCLSLMIFFALACQCMSTLAVVRRETRSWRWPIFLFAYMGVLAWVGSFAIYQGGRLLGFG